MNTTLSFIEWNYSLQYKLKYLWCENRASCDSGCEYVCLLDVTSRSTVDRYQLPDAISEPRLIFMVYDSQCICLDVKLILENSSLVILRKKCLCCFGF